MGVSLEGKVALVTGAGSGIGQATAMVLAREGARVVIADWNADGAAQTASMVKDSGGEGLAVRMDVSKASDVEALVKRITAAYGRLDCAVNNAGVQGMVATTVDCTEENWDRIISVNLKGVWLCMKFEIGWMLQQGHGSIVNVGSNFSLVGSRGMPAYSASKHGLVGLTKTAALEYARNKIRVNTVCPGPINTPLAANIKRDQPELAPVIEGLAESLAIGRWGEATEVAEVIAWFCTDAGSLVTGSVLSVDGGYTAQ